MALTKIGTDGIKDDAVTSNKVANAINSSIAANTAKDLTAISASNLTSGTIPDARFPATLPATSAANLTAIPAANITGTLPAISGANLTNLPASGVTVSNNADNRVVTGDGTNLNAESALTFDGTKLGINEASPVGLLHIDSDDTTTPLFIDTSTNNKALSVRNQNGGDGSLTIEGASNEVDWVFNTYSTSNALRVENDGKVMMGSSTQTANSKADNLVIYDSSAAGITIATGTTNQDCSVYFGDSDANNDGKIVYMTGNRQFRFYLDGSGSPVMQWNPDNSIYFNGNMYSSGGQYSTGSDLRIKSNLVRFTGTLEKLKQIVGYKFDIKVPATGATTSSAGVIAQDVEKVYPELVEEVEGYKHLQYNALIGVLVEAVKELTTKVETLETKVATLEAA